MDECELDESNIFIVKKNLNLTASFCTSRFTSKN
jgi:hypothetical protein